MSPPARNDQRRFAGMITSIQIRRSFFKLCESAEMTPTSGKYSRSVSLGCSVVGISLEGA